MQQQSPRGAISNFYGLGIAPALLAVLDRMNFRLPTPIQVRAIPVAIEGKDLVGIAQTGTGKTLAFGIPMLQLLAQTKKRGLVILPTRELALQVEESLRKLGKDLGARTAVLIGGTSMMPQIRELRTNPHILVGTPGRITDHLNQKTLRLDDVGILVLDEADRMLDMGFLPQVKKILNVLPRDRQTMLFSATMPEGIMRIAASSMRLPVRVEIAPTGTTVDKVSQELFIVPREQKGTLLKKLLFDHRGSALVFTRTKYGAKKVTRQLRSEGIKAAEIHSNRSLNQRKEALEGFKSGRYRVLVATDIASRGIDVVGIEMVLNYDLPSTSEDYVHRIGRTARAGAKGHAVTFATPLQQREVRAIERLIRKQLLVKQLPELPRVAFVPSFAHRRDRFRPRKRDFGRRSGNYGASPARNFTQRSR
ncbi:MAG: ATP-dependent RNA helicase RhlE [Parcubacteria group bacterium Gr01-1014_30]|nr:MAG: ATP-dependent RNA helicase RhlE [Parcubacteria group bacterium Gr01-1014_30]